ncbi:hypothetical protein G6549_05335 [Bacillus sp. MM2020_1]|nr:hypothetical protein [Bacillus sp. MM2020_1]
MSHPYKQFENTPLWNIINKAIAELVENDDIELKTQKEYIVGYISKLLIESNIVKECT